MKDVSNSDLARTRFKEVSLLLGWGDIHMPHFALEDGSNADDQYILYQDNGWVFKYVERGIWRDLFRSSNLDEVIYHYFKSFISIRANEAYIRPCEIVKSISNEWYEKARIDFPVDTNPPDKLDEALLRRSIELAGNGLSMSLSSKEQNSFDAGLEQHFSRGVSLQIIASQKHITDIKHAIIAHFQLALDSLPVAPTHNNFNFSRVIERVRHYSLDYYKFWDGSLTHYQHGNNVEYISCLHFDHPTASSCLWFRKVIDASEDLFD